MRRNRGKALRPGRARQGCLTRGAASIVCILAIFLVARPAHAQEPALFGRISDENGQAIAGAAVTLRAEARADREARSGADGNYELSGIEPGTYALEVERVGYLHAEQGLRLAPGERRRLDFRLHADTVLLEGVVIEGSAGRNPERARFENDPGVTARIVTGESLRTLPGLAEPDIMRAVEVLPGVISTSDFSSSFNVRGGSADQNLILLDGFPIFNPFHLGGLFSVFNSDAIDRAELLSGGFGAEYGGRVSSVLDVQSRVGGDGLRAEGGISLLASRLQLRSDLPRRLTHRLGVKRAAWLVSARRSYFDALLRPWFDFPYHLTDLQGRAEVELRGGGRVSVTGYAGADVLDLSNFEPPGEDSSSVLRLKWDWGNRVAGVRLQQPIGSDWVADTRLGYSSFSEALTFVDFGGTSFNSDIGLVSLHSDWVREVGPAATLRVGGAGERMRYRNFARGGGTVFLDGSDHGWLGAAYAALRWRPNSTWLVEPGFRLDSWWSVGSNHRVLAPRLAVKRFFAPDRSAALKISVGRYSQFLHSLRNEELPVSNDTWVLAGKNTPAVVSDQLQVGVEKYWGERWSASVEAYTRTFRGVTEINFGDDPNDPTDDLISGTGSAYGLDFLVKRTAGRLTGWTTVSLLRATRTLPDPTAAGWVDLPPTVTFPPIYDRRVDIDLVLQYRLPGKIEAGARWNFGSPIPYTRPVAQYFSWRYPILGGSYEPADQPGGAPLFIHLGDRNAERFPPYHRLDLTVRRTYHPSWGSWTPYLQVLNAYNRKNVLWYFYDYDRIPPTRSGLSMFPVLPAVGVEFAF